MENKYAVEILALNKVYCATVYEAKNLSELFNKAHQVNLCRMDVVELKVGECRSFHLMNAERFK